MSRLEDCDEEVRSEEIERRPDHDGKGLLSWQLGHGMRPMTRPRRTVVLVDVCLQPRPQVYCTLGLPHAYPGPFICPSRLHTLLGRHGEFC